MTASSCIRRRLIGQLRDGEGVITAQAKVTNKHHPENSRFYMVNYRFRAVRSDGMQFNVSVKDRHILKRASEDLSNGDIVSIKYLHHSPEFAMLEDAADSVEHSCWQQCQHRFGVLIGVLFTVVFGGILSNVMSRGFCFTSTSFFTDLLLGSWVALVFFLVRQTWKNHGRGPWHCACLFGGVGELKKLGINSEMSN